MHLHTRASGGMLLGVSMAPLPPGRCNLTRHYTNTCTYVRRRRAEKQNRNSIHMVSLRSTEPYQHISATGISRSRKPPSGEYNSNSSRLGIYAHVWVLRCTYM